MNSSQPPAPVGGTKAMQDLVNDAIDEGIETHAYGPSRAALLTAIAALEAQVPQWQPMETAPKDGSLVLIAWAGGGYPRTSRWLQNAQGWTVSTTQTLNPTHWMPLPPSPTGP